MDFQAIWEKRKKKKKQQKKHMYNRRVFFEMLYIVSFCFCVFMQSISMLFILIKIKLILKFYIEWNWSKKICYMISSSNCNEVNRCVYHMYVVCNCIRNRLGTICMCVFPMFGMWNSKEFTWKIKLLCLLWWCTSLTLFARLYEMYICVCISLVRLQ